MWKKILIGFLVLAAIGGVFDLLGIGEKEEPEPVGATNRPSYKYDVVANEDISMANSKRYEMTVILNESYSQEQIKEIAERIVEIKKDAEDFNAVVLFFYNKGDKLDGGFTVARVEYVTDGVWERASEVKAGDYSRHKYAYEFK